MYRILKRGFDIVICVLVVLLLWWLYLIIAAIIRFESPGPVLFRQERIGRYKRHFNVLKFRTMRADAPKDTPTHLLQNPETFITPVGRVLRRTSLDELPQVFNILKGEMSLVGPRPALWNQYDLIAERDRYGANDVPVGMTGWAQVNGRDEIPNQLKAELDGYYAAHCSLWLDLKIICRTFLSVLTARGVKEGGGSGGRGK